MEKKNNSAYILPVCATVAAILSVVIRVLLSISSLDADYGVYKRGAVLPTVYHILLAVVCAAFIVPPFIRMILKKGRFRRAHRSEKGRPDRVHLLRVRFSYRGGSADQAR